LVELYDDFAVGLPSIVFDEVFQMLRECLAIQLIFGRDLVVIGGTEQQGVAICREYGAVTDVPYGLLSFPLQPVLNLLWGHLTTENARKAVVNRTFELAFDPLQDPHP